MAVSMSRPFAVFDIDGTVIRWQLYHALADEMMRRGHMDQQKFKAVREARLTWKKRAGENSFLEYEGALVSLVDESLPGLGLSEFEAACQSVMSEYEDQVYTYTRDLIQDLRAKGYLLFAISASYSQIVSLFAEHYGFDDSAGSEYEIKDGQFTGKKLQLLKRDKKIKVLDQMIARHAASRDESIAVGDSESDIPMLSAAEQAIAFNPSKQLFKMAKANGWKVVLERKNMIYELEQRDGQYILAKTNGG
jgi:HAD superfamily hydrolase (TIGR01490 family)